MSSIFLLSSSISCLRATSSEEEDFSWFGTGLRRFLCVNLHNNNNIVIIIFFLIWAEIKEKAKEGNLEGFGFKSGEPFTTREKEPDDLFLTIIQISEFLGKDSADSRIPYPEGSTCTLRFVGETVISHPEGYLYELQKRLKTLPNGKGKVTSTREGSRQTEILEESREGKESKPSKKISQEKLSQLQDQ